MIRNIPGEEDQQLAIKIEQKCMLSIGILYDRYAAALLGIICSIIPDKQVGEDILQNVFIKACSQAASFHDSGCSLFTWLINIARQLAFDKIKNEYGNNVTPSNASPFELVYYKGLPYKEAMDSLGMTDTAFKNDLRSTVQDIIKTKAAT